MSLWEILIKYVFKDLEYRGQNNDFVKCKIKMKIKALVPTDSAQAVPNFKVSD